MAVVGIDAGQQSIKVVVLESGALIASREYVTDLDSDSGSREALGIALGEAGIEPEQIVRIAGTGLGRKEVSFADIRKTQEMCVGRGAFHLFKRECTVVDAGAGGCRVVRISPQGKVIDFAGNSKCASGTGSFLEAACEVLQLDINRLDALAIRAKDIARVSTTCAVFAESAIISNIHYGYALEDICAGICESVVSRIMDVLNRVGGGKDLFFCGGVAQSKTIGRMLERFSGVQVHVPARPLMITALGAALVAGDVSRGMN